MKRHKNPNDDLIAAGEDVRGGRSSPQEPLAATFMEDSREPQAAGSPASAPMATSAPAMAVGATATTTVNATMSDITYDRATSFELRDESRSAFSSVRTSPAPQAADDTIEARPEEKHDQRRHDRQELHEHHSVHQNQDLLKRTTTHMPRPVRPASEPDPLPYQSPLRYYQQEQSNSSEGEEVDPGPAPASAPAASAPDQYQYQYPGYPPYPPQHGQGPYHQYHYSGYYPPGTHPSEQERGSTPPSTMDRYRTYPGYPPHQQEYNTYPYSYYPSPAAAPGQYPGHTQQHPYYYSEATPTPTHSSTQDTGGLKEIPSAITESTKGTTPLMQQPSTAAERLDLSSPSHSVEDDRKPPARKGILKKDDSPSSRVDYEPIPLDQISAIPVLSEPGALERPPSPRYALGSYSEGYHHSSPPPLDFAAPSTTQRSRSAARRTPTTRRPQRTIAPSSSGSSSTAGGGVAEGSWERRFAELTEFKGAHGHCEVPQNYAENTSLGTWVNKQRMEHKNRMEGKNSSLNDSRLERLQSVGFRWAKRKGQASWDEKYNELVAYKARYGNCHVPTKYKDNTALGRWVSTQRAEYKKYQEGQSKTSMNANKIRRLENIGFAWFMAL